jgi:hypothetical protein
MEVIMQAMTIWVIVVWGMPIPPSFVFIYQLPLFAVTYFAINKKENFISSFWDTDGMTVCRINNLPVKIRQSQCFYEENTSRR